MDSENKFLLMKKMKEEFENAKQCLEMLGYEIQKLEEELFVE